MTRQLATRWGWGLCRDEVDGWVDERADGGRGGERWSWFLRALRLERVRLLGCHASVKEGVNVEAHCLRW